MPNAATTLSQPIAQRLVTDRGQVAVADVPRLTGLSDADAAELVSGAVRVGIATMVDDALVDVAVVATMRSRARDQVLGGDGVELATLASRLGVGVSLLRVALDGDAALVVDRDMVRDAAHIPVTESPEAVELMNVLAASPFAPPADGDAALTRALVREGALIDVAGIVFAASAVDRARELVREWLALHGTITVADARDLLVSSRKYVVPLLEHFDREGMTRRRGDVRIPGPTFNAHRRQ